MPEPYERLLTLLLAPSTHPLFSLPVSPHKPILSPAEISSLSLHPVLESLLHILNLDLPSAHFLLRHMQAAPAWEAMYLHGLLHRVEGDLENARAWYKDVGGSDALEAVWGGKAEYPGSKRDDGAPCWDGHDDSPAAQRRQTANGSNEASSIALERALAFLDQLMASKASVRSGQSPADHLVAASLEELSRLWNFCVTKFGTDTVADASGIWVSMAEKHADMAEKMITGGEGWREF